MPGLIVSERSVRVFSWCEAIHLAVACFNRTPLESSSTLAANSLSSSSPDSSGARFVFVFPVNQKTEKMFHWVWLIVLDNVLTLKG